MSAEDTIAAIATGAGPAAIGIVRISGPQAPGIGARIAARSLTPRHAHHVALVDAHGATLDRGIALYFPGPASPTGEDVLELHVHGGAVLLDLVLERVLGLGARRARPGEFTERAFLNGKLDLTQAEAIADLISAGSARAARAASASLQGAFSTAVRALVEEIIALRVDIEASIDFAEESIAPAPMRPAALDRLRAALAGLLGDARKGVALSERVAVVIAGAPNVGKSSVLNRLARADRAIVAATPGTTRDIVREQILLDGIPIEILDTAGVRTSADPIEAEGMRRALAAIARADHLLVVLDASARAAPDPALLAARGAGTRLTWVVNKIDLVGEPCARIETAQGVEIHLSARTGSGLELLEAEIRSAAQATPGEAPYSARARHIDALERTADALERLDARASPELNAEALRLAQLTLAEITGDFTSEDLLGEIFSRFCIGK
jgi:tRNA modification GTPase